MLFREIDGFYWLEKYGDGLRDPVQTHSHTFTLKHERKKERTRARASEKEMWYRNYETNPRPSADLCRAILMHQMCIRYIYRRCTSMGVGVSVVASW